MFRTSFLFLLASLLLTVPVALVEAQEASTLYAAHNEIEIAPHAVAPIIAWLRDQKFALRTTSIETVRLGPGTVPDATIEAETNEAMKARKILDKVLGNMFPVPNLLKRARLYWISGENIKRSADVVLFRDRSTDGRTFRHLFRVNTPTKLAGYTASTRRLINPGTDATTRARDEVRIFSSVTNRARRAAEANQADPLFGGALSLDDLLVASENFESFDVRVVDEREIMLPFLKSADFKATIGPSSVELSDTPTDEKKKPESFDLQVAAPKGGEFVNWNFQSRELPQFSPWVPTNIFFVTRPVWVVEFLSRDPYFPYGKFYLVIDRELYLPFYKMVYDRVGEYRKTIMGSWALIDTGGKLTKARVPFCPFVLSVDQSTEVVNILNTQSVDLGLDMKGSSMALIEKWFKQTQSIDKKAEKGTPASEEQTEVEDAEAPKDTETDVDTEVIAQ
jgi:hypothetical protein